MKGSRDTLPRLTRVTRTTRGADTEVPHRTPAADPGVSRGLSLSVSEAGVGRGEGGRRSARGLRLGAFHLPRREASPVETKPFQPWRRARRCDVQLVLHLIDGDGFAAEPAGQADPWPFPCVFGVVPGQGPCLKVLPGQRPEMLFAGHRTQSTVNRVTTRRPNGSSWPETVAVAPVTTLATERSRAAHNSCPSIRNRRALGSQVLMVPADQELEGLGVQRRHCDLYANAPHTSASRRKSRWPRAAGTISAASARCDGVRLVPSGSRCDQKPGTIRSDLRLATRPGGPRR